MTSVSTLAVFLALAAGTEFDVGAQWTYQGTLIAEKGEIADSRKDFSLTIWVADSEPGTRATCLWTIEEKGRGAWPWPDRFGRFTIGQKGKIEEGSGPSLFYQREEGASVVSLPPSLWIAAEPLAAGKTWQQGDLEFTVEGEAKAGDRDCWSISVANAYGPRRTFLLEKESPAVATVRERLTLGQGQQFELQFEMKSAAVLSVAEFAALEKGFDSLLELREQLSYVPRRPPQAWKDTELETLKAELPKVQVPASAAPLTKLVQAAADDLKSQRNRAGAVAALEKQTVGGKMPAFNLPDLQGKTLDSAGLQGKVTVLHFWEYRDTPLQEPYGQIGYLDFLNRQRKDDKVRIIGVNCDPRLADKNERGRAAASARKLVAFMRVGYPVVLDDGKTLENFGDPRVAGAKLPLFVVVDAKGTVVHYRVGEYKVDRERGLVELEEVITKALASGG